MELLFGVVRGRGDSCNGASGACNYRHVDQVSPPQNIEVTMYTTNSNNSPTTKYIRMLRQKSVLAKVRDVCLKETAWKSTKFYEQEVQRGQKAQTHIVSKIL